MVDTALVTYLESFLSDARRQRFFEVIKQRTKHFTVATEDVYQLHNTSAVIRSCDVFGIQEIQVIEEINSKRIDREIAMGAQKWVDIRRFNSVTDTIDKMKQEGYQIVATTPHINDMELSDFDITQKSCFFFGRETEGLSDAVMENADCFLKIPMYGFTESLNISVSAAIILQNVTNRLRKTNLDWNLSEGEQWEKRLDWCKKTLKSHEGIIQDYYDKNGGIHHKT